MVTALSVRLLAAGWGTGRGGPLARDGEAEGVRAVTQRPRPEVPVPESPKDCWGALGQVSGVASSPEVSHAGGQTSRKSHRSHRILMKAPKAWEVRTIVLKVWSRDQQPWVARELVGNAEPGPRPAESDCVV